LERNARHRLDWFHVARRIARIEKEFLYLPYGDDFQERLAADRFIEYEALLNDFVAKSRSLVLCQYDSALFDLAVIHDVLRTHPVAVLGDQFCPNPYYEPPELFLHKELMEVSECKRKRVGWWINQLETARSSEREKARVVAILREREERIHLLLDLTAEAIYGIDLQGNCTFSNPACARLLGYAYPSLLEGKNMHSIMHDRRPDGKMIRESECGICRACLQGEETHVDNEIFRKADGTEFDVEYWSHPIRQGTEIIGAVVTFLDISDRKMLGAQLRQAQKMEALGQLAGGVAHDFNNLLITGYSELLLASLEPGGSRQKFVEEIKNAGQGAALLTRQLLAFSRQQVLAPQVLDLNEVIHKAEKLLRRVIGEDVEFTTVLDPELNRAKADPGQLEQVLVNLAVNARDAMIRGGKLSVATKNIELSESDCELRLGVRPGRYAMLEVTDSGPGMSEDVKRQIFEPFFTTKGPGYGTGLGLAVVHGIVQQCKGHIEVSSERGVGTSFKIYLPRVEEQVSREEILTPVPASRGTETILLVEDEGDARALILRVLRECGYTVIEASDGEEGLSIGKNLSAPIDLLMTDVVMPRLGGRQLAEQLVIVHPEMRVLYLSGYTNDAVVRYGVLRNQVNFLQKPFSPNALAAKVREALTNRLETLLSTSS
jgi:two-component system, cell cycle sensor histidine kinase and response regulator CckA